MIASLRLLSVLSALIGSMLLAQWAFAAVPPALPQVFMRTAYEPPVGGSTHVVRTSAEFQLALAAAQLGDIIQLEAGATFTGPFVLPNKTGGTGWIYIISSKYAELPEPCQRVSPADAPNMPKIVVAPGSGGSIQTVAGSHHYRFVGIEFSPTPGSFVTNIVQIGRGETTVAAQPNNIVFDRCYIHGDSAIGSRRGVLMNGAYIAVVDSYVSDCKEDGADSQALAAYSGTGPFKIVNNYLEGAGENIMFGGADPTIPNSVPSDIEMRCNHFFKPLTWMGEQWDIKNLLEFKNAQRVLVEGNRFENCWANAQTGFALLISPRNQQNTAPWSVVQDLTIRFNTFVNIAQGITMSGRDNPNISERTARILIQHNVVHVNNLGGGDGRLFQVLNGPTDVVLDHNTGFASNSFIITDGSPKTDHFVFQNNIVKHGTYGMKGSGTAVGNATLAAWFNPNWTFTHNAIIGGDAAYYPSGNFFPSTESAVGFVDPVAGDFRLRQTSPYKWAGNDGKDLGADIDSIELMMVYRCDAQVTAVDHDAVHLSRAPYPNPADEMMYVSPTATRVSIVDLLGRHVLTTNPVSGSVDASTLPDGTYMVQVVDGAAFRTHIVVVQH